MPVTVLSTKDEKSVVYGPSRGDVSLLPDPLWLRGAPGPHFHPD